MTTVACNRDMMVSDSRCTLIHKELAWPVQKIVKQGNIILGAAGDGADCTKFLKWGLGGFKSKDEPKWSPDTTGGTSDAVVGLMLDPSGIYVWSWADPEPEKIMADFYAVGSGGKAARAAMAMGADPIKVVEIACEIDVIYSGLPLQLLKLKD